MRAEGEDGAGVRPPDVGGPGAGRTDGAAPYFASHVASRPHILGFFFV